ncbi:hypothetical protein ACH5RR_031475 [Cinchona calisaya]|uniref:Non-haem dioxygenase N-terminal domain-containing protein n=1 Tax=Cinchona calisaya TaxID=153742 RepID=A0ABD2YGF0_9GENT
MDKSIAKEITTQSGADNDDRLEHLKAFDDTKAGVNGLIDAGITSLPKIFIQPVDELVEESNIGRSQAQVPVTDLSGIQSDDQRRRIVSELRRASEEWGFFQVVNHGIPESALNGMIDSICKFHEQDTELKKEDSLTISLVACNELEPDELPQDHIGGLQFLHDDQWTDVPPIPGRLVASIADLLQELTSDKSPALYREFTVTEYLDHFMSKPIDKSGLDHFKI